MAFQGSLDEMPLPDLLQLVSVGAKTGVFELRRSGELGRIFVRGGQIVHAELGEVAGEEAIYAVAIWEAGEFRFDVGAESPAVTIERSNTNLLMEAARRMDEWKVLARKIPSTRLVPVLAQLAATTSVSLSPAEWEVARWSDGRRSIEEIAAALGRARFEVCSTLYGLVASGLVVLREPAPSLPVASRIATAAAPAPLPADTVPAARPAPAIDLRDLAGRASRLVYQGLGPEGETQVVKIERAASARELAALLLRARDLLRRVGKDELAAQVDAELARLPAP